MAGLESGADDYPTKPFNAEELKARLRTGERILHLEGRLVEARELMRFKATHDALTSIWNRGVIMDLLGRELTRSQREAGCTIVLQGGCGSLQVGQRYLRSYHWRRSIAGNRQALAIVDSLV